MKIATLWTNLSDKLAATFYTSEFRKQFITLLADSLQRPVDACAVIVHAGDDLCQLGLDARKPAIILNVSCAIIFFSWHQFNTDRSAQKSCETLDFINIVLSADKNNWLHGPRAEHCVRKAIH